MKKIANSKNSQKASWLLLGSNVSQHFESVYKDNREKSFFTIKSGEISQ